MVGRVLVALALIVGVARADSPKLAQAQKAIDGGRWDEAEKLLVDALKDGGNSPAAVAEIYRLSASTAVVLERADLAEQYYRRWLALDPNASLASGLAPKIREPFVKAQAYMNAHGRLVAKIARTATVDVVVETDPLGMAVAAAIDGGPPTKLDAERRATFPAGASAAVLDEYGNRLVELAVPTEVTKQPPSTTITKRHVPFFRKATVWAVAAGVTIAGGGVFGYLARDADKEARGLRSVSEEHTFAEYTDATDRRDRYALVANGLFIAGGLFAATAAVMYFTAPTETVVTPSATGDSVGVAITRAF